MFNKILLAFDGSPAAGKAFDLALDLAMKYGSELEVLAVARPPDFEHEAKTDAVVENSRNHYRRVLEPLKDQVRAMGLTVQFEVASGHPAEHIVLEAQKRGVQLVVLGHRGHGLSGRWLVGSVAKHVMQHAPCAVLVAR